jgi:hypothetical protein
VGMVGGWLDGWLLIGWLQGGRLAHCLAGWLLSGWWRCGWLAHWLVGWLADWLAAGWLACLIVVCFTCLLAGLLVGFWLAWLPGCLAT